MTTATLPARQDPGTDWPATSRATFAAEFAPDLDLARMVRDALRTLAQHSEPYARAFSRCPGVRLAGEFNAGMVEHASSKGRVAMQHAYVKIVAAAAVAPGLDTNDLMDRVTGRTNPRLAHLAGLAAVHELAADDQDRADLARHA